MKKQGYEALSETTRVLIMPFSVLIFCDSNNMTDAITTKFRGKWCNRFGYTNFALELDSLVITTMLTNRKTNNLKIKMVIDRTVNIIDLAYKFEIHCSRLTIQIYTYKISREYH